MVQLCNLLLGLYSGTVVARLRRSYPSWPAVFHNTVVCVAGLNAVGLPVWRSGPMPDFAGPLTDTHREK